MTFDEYTKQRLKLFRLLAKLDIRSAVIAEGITILRQSLQAGFMSYTKDGVIVKIEEWHDCEE